MAVKWTMRLAPAGTLLGADYLAVGYSDSAHRTIGENERPETIVEAAAARQHERPLKLTPLEIATIQSTLMVERLRVSGELEPINRATLHAKDGGWILEIRAREGHAVEAGVVLLRFDTEEFQSIIEQREGH
ncbi:hypothetical protein [Chelativorans sp. YIM 93263]|uniref:hypothetical protein n=1 Tax=Chelativorans sp. YIM 93263 TaxID=2906648 RepID=UPI0023793384|nr:hypothetical protein [Chelativorans sp. YIM 93263]